MRVVLSQCLVQAPALVPWTWPGLDTAVACVRARVQCPRLLRSIIDPSACQLWSTALLGCCLDHSDIVGSALVYIVNHEFYAESLLQTSQQIEHVQTRTTSCPECGCNVFAFRRNQSIPSHGLACGHARRCRGFSVKWVRYHRRGIEGVSESTARKTHKTAQQSRRQDRETSQAQTAIRICQAVPEVMVEFDFIFPAGALLLQSADDRCHAQLQRSTLRRSML